MNNKNELPPKVLGIGGIFFKTTDPKSTRAWYAQHLGLEVNDWGCTFESRAIDHPEGIEQLQWSPFAQDTQYFEPSAKDFMINYRVQNIEAFVQQLRDAGVNILDEIEDTAFGKFVHLMDTDGNKLELWEAPHS